MRTGEQTDMTELSRFSKFVNAPKNSAYTRLHDPVTKFCITGSTKITVYS
jgi:hypothetical protein